MRPLLLNLVPSRLWILLGVMASMADMKTEQDQPCKVTSLDFHPACRKESAMKPVKSRIGPLGFPAVVLVLVFLVGCATTPIPGASHDLLKFLQIGQTTRQEVLLKLGQPSASFEQEKILTYRLGEDAKQGYYLIIPNATMKWQVVHYSLVLVFDSSGVLQRQNLVAVQ